MLEHAEEKVVEEKVDKSIVVSLPSEVLKLRNILSDSDSFIQVRPDGIYVSDGHKVLIRFPGETKVTEPIQFPATSLLDIKLSEEPPRLYHDLDLVIRGNVVEVWWVAEIVPISGIKPIPITEPIPLDRFLVMDSGTMLGIPYRTLKRIVQAMESTIKNSREKEQTVFYIGAVNQENIAIFTVDHWGEERLRGWVYIFVPEA